MKSKRNILILAIVLAGAGLVATLTLRGAPAPKTETAESAAEATASPAVVADTARHLGDAEAAKPANGALPGTDAEADDENGPLVPPSVAKLRQEIQNDPHQTPESLLEFAETIGDRLDDAETSPEKARSLFSDLEVCMQNQGGSSSVQALCLWNASQLAEQYPEFAERYKTMNDKSPSAVKLLLQVADGE